MKKVAVMMGSDSDLPVVEKALDALKEFGISSMKEIPESLLNDSELDSETLLIEDKSEDLEGVLAND